MLFQLKLRNDYADLKSGIINLIPLHKITKQRYNVWTQAVKYCYNHNGLIIEEMWQIHFSKMVGSRPVYVREGTVNHTFWLGTRATLNHTFCRSSDTMAHTSFESGHVRLCLNVGDRQPYTRLKFSEGTQHNR